VNTRCIYHRIKPSPEDSDNVTLCPVVDFANHTRVSPQISPAVSAIVARGDFIVVSCPGESIEAGDELFLTYGCHANRTLFVEYGFIDVSPFPENDGEVDVQDLVESLIEAKGHGTRLQEILIEEGYWGYAVASSLEKRLTTSFFQGLDATFWPEACSSVLSADNRSASLCPQPSPFGEYSIVAGYAYGQALHYIGRK
jgi:hypothetical protein